MKEAMAVVFLALAAIGCGPAVGVDGKRISVTGVSAAFGEVAVHAETVGGTLPARCRAWLDGVELAEGCGWWGRDSVVGLYLDRAGELHSGQQLDLDAGLAPRSVELVVDGDVVAAWPERGW